MAATARARLLGLSGLRAPPPCGLLLPRTRSVHTFGMRFALDLVWLDARGRVARIDLNVPPRRLRACRPPAPSSSSRARRKSGTRTGPRSDD